MFCPKCGGKNDEDSRFCAQCGGTFPLKKTDKGVKARKRSIPVLGGIVICLAVLVAAGIGAIAYFDVDTSRIPIVSTLFPRLPFTKEVRMLFPVKVGGKYGFIDKTGKIVINPQFDEAWAFKEGLATVEVNGKWGFIDKTGKIVINPEFDGIRASFNEGLAGVKVNGKWGFIDKTGKIVINPQFDGAWVFNEGLATVEVNGKWGFIDKTGKIVINLQYKDASPFSEGLAYVTSTNTNYGGFIDKTGAFAIPPRFLSIGSEFSEGLACVPIEERQIGYIDKSGKPAFVLPHNAVAHDPFQEGMASVLFLDSDKWGFIDKTGKIVINPQFDLVSGFNEGLAGVAVNRKWGFIDKTGKIVINPQFDGAEGFNGGLALVVIGNKPEDIKLGYIDKTGRFVWKPSR